MLKTNFDINFTETVTPPDYTVSAPFLQEIKDYLRITHSFDDTLLNRFAVITVQHIEKLTGRKFLTQTLRTWYNKFNENTYRQRYFRESHKLVPEEFDEDIILPYLPVNSVESIKTYDDADSETAVDSFKYRLANQDKDFWSIIRLKDSEYWPTDIRNLSGLAVEYICGEAATIDALPELYKQAIIEMVAYQYQHRGCGCDSAYQNSGAESTLGSLKVYHL